jgi:hypothetical protein
MQTIRDLLLCRQLHMRGLASLCLPPDNFLLAPSLDGRQDVLEAVATYERLYRVGCDAVTLLQVASLAMVSVIAWKVMQ